MSKKTIYSQEELDFIKNNYKTKTYKEITDDINKFADIKKDEKQIRTKAALLGYRKQYADLFEDYFEKIDSDEKAYWLGFIYADGYIVANNTEIGIELSRCDETHLEKFLAAINAQKKIFHKEKYIKIANNKKMSHVLTSKIRVYSSKMRNDLIKNGISLNKTYSKTFPIVNRKYFYSFLRGYFDGDGCLYVKNSNVVSVTYTACHDECLKFIKSALHEDGIKSEIYKETDKKYRLYILGGKTGMMKFLNKLYNDSTVYLDRKYRLYLDCLDI